MLVSAPARRHGHGLGLVQVGVHHLLGHQRAGVDEPGRDLGGLELSAVVALRQCLGHLRLAVEVKAPALQPQVEVHAAVEVPACFDAPVVLLHPRRQGQLALIAAAPAAYVAPVHAASMPPA